LNDLLGHYNRPLNHLGTNMNRRKKIKDILTKRNKQAILKANPKKAKPKYISKAERAKMEAEGLVENNTELATSSETIETQANEQETNA
jgi:hypothetical protein